MKFIRPAALLLMLGSASGLAAAADPSLTSFADLYRLTVSGAQAATMIGSSTGADGSTYVAIGVSFKPA